ncbi:hypothetical protein P3X46_021616 [Hevea brasiliensis]|uniref:Retrotransposon gag domain-containing protein n=1 Tax=Hevea brasiliensis TaxID=3981 RepID=A0ABQ9LG55_HEVBR|nr:hypothetical protein P3X46_021616 [Hevea brasiliensis]
MGLSVVTAAVTTKLKDPWEVVDHARRLGAYDFEGSFNADVADKWLKRVIKVFDLVKLANADRMDNVHGLLQGKADSWFDGIHHKIRSDLTLDKFMIEFRQEYLIKSYRKGKQDAFFRLFKSSLSVREYVDQFEDLYGFVLDILPSEEAKCDRFRQVRQEEKEYEQKMSRKHGQSSSQGFRERPAKRGGSSS